MSHGIPKYCRHNVRDLGYVNWKGKRKYLPGKYDSVESRNAYWEFVRAKVAVDVPTPNDPKALTITALVRAYMKFADEHYEDKGHQSHWKLMNIIAVKLEEAYGTTKVVDFGPKALKEFRKTLLESGNSREYINSEISRVRKIFKWAVSEEMIPVSIFEALKTVDGIARGRMGAKDHPKRQPVSWEDVDAIASILHEPVRTMVYVQWYTGVRSDSLVNAHADQFDTSDDDCWVWHPKHKTEYRGVELPIPLGPKARALLAPLIDCGDYIFKTRLGTTYKTWTYRREITRAQDRHLADAIEEYEKMPEDERGDFPTKVIWTPHQIRHSMGKRIREKHGIEAAQALLGHESLQATQVYSEARFLLAKQIAQQEG